MKDCGKLEFLRKEGLWQITTTPDVAMRIKRMFPRISISRSTTLAIRETPEVAMDLEWLMQRYPLSCPEIGRLKRKAREYRKMIGRIESLEATPPPGNHFQMALPARDYQAFATSMYLELKRLFIGDDVGLGKTVCAIASFAKPQTLPALVVVKAHLPLQWADEIAKFMPAMRTHIIKQNAEYPLPEADVYIISYSKLSHWWGILARRVRSIVFDEIQELRIMSSLKYQAAKRLCEEIGFRVGLSATPIGNYGGEIWPVMNLLAPDELGSQDEFNREWCVSGPGGKQMASDPVALGHYLRNTRLMVRRTRKEVGRQLPPVQRFVQDIQIDRGVYEKSISSAEELARTILSGQFLERGQAAREFDLKLRQATGLAKAPYVAELVRMLVESGEKVLLGGWHRSVYDVWKKRLGDLKLEFYTGEESVLEKAAAAAAFIKGDADVLVMSLRSGAGLNGIQGVCRTVVLGEIDWSPAVHTQFIGRPHRDGQDESVQVFIPVASVGSDPTMASVLGLKQAQSTGIVDLGQDDGRDFVETDPLRIRQLAIDFLRARGLPLPETDEVNGEQVA